MKPDSLVAIAEILKEQSFPKNGIRTYKCRLLNRGSELIKQLSRLYTADSKLEIKLLDESAPLGGAWGQAPFVLIKVSESLNLNQGQLLACMRSDFPKVDSTSEYYLSDLLGAKVVDEFGDPQGEIAGFYFDQEKLNSPVNLRIVHGEKEYECPQEWIEGFDLGSETVTIEGVYRWKL